MVLPGSASARFYEFVGRRWLPLGYLVLLTGLFWVVERSQYSKAFYVLLVLPAFIAAVMRPAVLGQLVREPIVQAFLLFSAWVLLSLAWTSSTDSPGSLSKRPLYVFMLLLACAVMAMQEERLLLGVLRIAGVIASVAAAVGIVDFLVHPPALNRLIGTGGLVNPLLTSHLLGFFSVYWLTVWTTRIEGRAWLPPLALLPLLGAILATGSRTPLMAIAVSIGWLLLVDKGRRVSVVASVLALIGVALAYFLPDSILQRGLSYRPELWQAALNQAIDHLWFGYGYGSEFRFRIPGNLRSWLDPHNVELAVLLELGLVGLSIWGLMFGLAIARCLRLNRQPEFKVASSLLIFGLAAGMTEGSNFLSRPNESWFLTWLPLSLVIGLSLQQRLREKA
ncbi:O-Antigen ligase [compost metagenome]